MFVNRWLNSLAIASLAIAATLPLLAANAAAADRCEPAEMTIAGVLRSPIVTNPPQQGRAPLVVPVDESLMVTIPDYVKKPVLFRGVFHRVASQSPVAGTRVAVRTLRDRVSTRLTLKSVVRGDGYSGKCVSVTPQLVDRTGPEVFIQINGRSPETLDIGPQGVPVIIGRRAQIETFAIDNLSAPVQIRTALDGAPYRGDLLDSYGIHTVVALARDASGNVSSSTFQFENRIAPYQRVNFYSRGASLAGGFLQGSLALYTTTGAEIEDGALSLGFYTTDGERLALHHQSRNTEEEYVRLVSENGEMVLQFRISEASADLSALAWIQVIGMGPAGDLSEIVKVVFGPTDPRTGERPMILIPGSSERNPAAPGVEGVPVTTVPLTGECRWGLFMNPVRMASQLPGDRLPPNSSPISKKFFRSYDTDGFENWSESYSLTVAPTFSDGFYDVSAKATEAQGQIEGLIRTWTLSPGFSWLRDSLFDTDGMMTFFTGSKGRRSFLQDTRAMDVTLALVGSCSCKICDIAHEGVSGATASCTAEGTASAAAYSSVTLQPGCPKDSPQLAGKKFDITARCLASPTPDQNVEAEIYNLPVNLPGIENPSVLPDTTESVSEEFSCYRSDEDGGYGARCVSENRFRVRAGVLAYARVDRAPGGASFLASALSTEKGAAGLIMTPVAGPVTQCSPAGNGVPVRISASTPGEARQLFGW